MREVTLKITFPDDETYYIFLDNWSCSDFEDEDLRIPHNCKIKWVRE